MSTLIKLDYKPSSNCKYTGLESGGKGTNNWLPQLTSNCHNEQHYRNSNYIMVETLKPIKQC